MWAGISRIREGKSFHSREATTCSCGKVSFQALTAASPQTGSGAADGKQSRFRSCWSPSVRPSIPASLHPSLPKQLWSWPSQGCVIRRKPSNRPGQTSQILARAGGGGFYHLSQHLCKQDTPPHPPRLLSGSFFSLLVDALRSCPSIDGVWGGGQHLVGTLVALSGTPPLGHLPASGTRSPMFTTAQKT